MANKITKRLTALLLLCILFMTSAAPAFAETFPLEDVPKSTVENTEASEMSRGGVCLN